MSRRHRQSETEIGSDSFLDIIANIVGILIILIVVTGVRIGQSPLSLESELTGEQEKNSQDNDSGRGMIETAGNLPDAISTRSDSAIEPGVSDLDKADSYSDSMEPVPVQRVGTTEAPLWSIPQSGRLPEQPVPPIVIEQWRQHSPAERNRHERQLAELESLRQAQQQLEKTPSLTTDLTTGERQRLARTQNRLDTLNAELLRSKNNYERRQTELKETETELARIRERVETRERRAKLIEQKLAAGDRQEPVLLHHDTSPIGESVKSRELHYILKGGRIAEVPIEQLLERVREQIQKRKDWILRSNKHRGVAGPIGGFQMEYLVERQTLSTLEQLQVGTGLIRIGLSQWTIQPDPETLIEETVAQASSSTSRFLVSVRTAPLDASCTFWVYPDSFTEYQQLKKLVYESGLRVAGRPLPEGIPIGGSPRGSRSVSQ